MSGVNFAYWEITLRGVHCTVRLVSTHSNVFEMRTTNGKYLYPEINFITVMQAWLVEILGITVQTEEVFNNVNKSVI